MRVANMFVAAMFIAGHAVAGQYVYPAKGQSPEQQKKDEAACHTWAIEQSKYDPANPPEMPAATTQAAAPQGPSGARVRGAARGAVIGGVADGDVGKAAVTGALLGGSRERREHRRSRKESQAQAQQQQAAAADKRKKGQAEYNKARSVCLEGRGYTVK